MKTERQQDQEVAERLRRENLARVEAGGCAPPVLVPAAPKYNEVDEKAENWEYCRDLRIAVTDGKNGARATLNGHGAPAGISLYHGDYVAELRAEVERLREANELYSFAMNTAGIDELKRRADAAERRVGELEKLLAAARRAIGDHHAPNDCYATGPLTGDAFLDLVQCPACAFLEQHEALTGADPT